MMDNNLKEIWGSQQPAALPDISAILADASRLKRKTILAIIRRNTVLLLTAAFTVWVWVHYQPQMVTTKVGIIFMIAAINMYIVSSSSAIPLLMTNKDDNDSAQFLDRLIALRQRQMFIQRSIITGYFVLLSAGLGLYMVEYAMMMGLVQGAIAYAVTFAWIAFSWFYIRPRTAQKQLGPLNDMIKQLENVNRQLAD